MLGVLAAAAAAAEPGVAGDLEAARGDAAEALERLRDGDFRARRAARKRLLAIGEPAVPALAAAARTDDAEVSATARELLQQIGCGIDADTTREVARLLTRFGSADAGVFSAEEVISLCRVYQRRSGSVSWAARLHGLLSGRRPLDLAADAFYAFEGGGADDGGAFEEDFSELAFSGSDPWFQVALCVLEGGVPSLIEHLAEPEQLFDDFEDAELNKMLAAVSEIDDRRVRLLSRILINVWSETASRDRVLQALAGATETVPDIAVTAAVDAAYARGDWQALVTHATALIERGCPHTGHRMRGIAESQLKRHEPAISDFRKALAAGGDEVELYGAIASCYAELKNWEAAEKTCRDALERHPDSAQLRSTLGRVLLLAGEKERAEAALEQAVVGLDASDQELLQAASAALAREDYERALALSQQGYELSGQPMHLLLRGLARAALGKPAEGLADINAALGHDPPLYRPTLPNAYVARAVVGQMVGDQAQVKADLDRAIELGMPREKIERQYGYRCFMLGDLAGAAKHFAAAPDDFQAWYSRTWLYFARWRHTGKPDRTVFAALAENGRKLEPWQSELLQRFRGESTDAKCLAAAEDDSNQAETFFYLGQLYLCTGDREQAEVCFQRCIDLKATAHFEWYAARVELKRLWREAE
jgi:tetratricopeptide (TPR) repeat protein